ncbi:MAG: CRISPR-associated endonuclease Cas2 [Thermomicrobiales bacterium]|nr:CRISPR-associated endonuclease Cas2 [Thermomicrobiales bacterium]
MEVLVTYDVATETSAGRRRLRRVANVCLAFGQRVQKSVFECRVTEAQLEDLEHRLRREIDETEDSLRIYRLAGPRERVVKVVGVLPPNDFREPLIV